eukprot:620848-Prorocentrum_minimum.AAC.3
MKYNVNTEYITCVSRGGVRNMSPMLPCKRNTSRGRKSGASRGEGCEKTWENPPVASTLSVSPVPVASWRHRFLSHAGF